MPSFRMIEVDKLLEPHNPQRTETLHERIDELRDSMRTNGLQQPIGVQIEGEEFRIIWGHRRSIAATQLGWSHVPAMVYLAEEPVDHDQLMGAENYHRTQTNDVEEARYYARILPRYPEGTIGMARELNVPQGRIERLLGVLQGDDKVLAALEKREISLAQAHEINQFESVGYRMQALERAKVEGLGADMIRRWRSDLRRQGIDQAAVITQAEWAKPVVPAGDVGQAVCEITGHMHPVLDRKCVWMCNPHWNLILEALELYGQYKTLEEAGLGVQFRRLLRQAEKELEGDNGRGPTPES